MKTTGKQKLLAVLISLAMLLSAIPVLSFSAFAADTVPYVVRSWDSGSQTLTESAADLTEPYTSMILVFGYSLFDGWYVLDTNRTFSERVTVYGTVRILLKDGFTLTCEKGIRVPEGATLEIYGQTGDSGKLIATGDSYNAGIGSNDEDDDEEDGAGTIRIFGGEITATGGTDAAGIGGGNEAYGGTVTVYGGKVTATGGDLAPGIGSGDEQEDDSRWSVIYTQYGGDVTAYGRTKAAGIGGGDHTNGGTVTVYGGKLYAEGGHEPTSVTDCGAGIGGGNDGNGGTFTMYGGDVTARGGRLGAGIGGGDYGRAGTVRIYGGKVTATGGYLGAGIGTGEWGEGGSVTIYSGTIRATGGDKAAGIGGGNDGGGVAVTIYDGDVTAIGTGESTSGAGIGSGNGCGLNAKIRIYGGVVTASGGSGSSVGQEACGGAGIGTGSYGGQDNDHTGQIIISGGSVSASGGKGATGIGGGYYSPAETIEISGGSVSANPGYILECAGIGVGAYGDEEYGSVTITGGTVRVTGSTGGPRPAGPYAIGISEGCDPDDLPGNFLTIGEKMCVRNSDDGAPVGVYSRVASCMRGVSYALISECDHPQPEYFITKNSHRPICGYCENQSAAVDHTFVGEDHICSVCGYQYSGQLFTLTFDADGGSGSMRTYSFMPNEGFHLPECGFTAPVGKKFDHWSVALSTMTYTSFPGSLFIAFSDCTATAVWADILYQIDVADTEHGEVTADKVKAAMGEGVAITAEPEEGYLLTSLTVADAKGGPVAVTDSSFPMPASDVTVTAAFAPDPDYVAAAAVEAAIAGIGEVALTEESNAKIVAARAAYEALTDAQKALVDNYSVLTAAEDEYTALAAAAQQAQADREAADTVINAISAIGEVSFAEESGEKIEAARAAYEALTDAQKALVDNYSVLTAAEDEYTALAAAAQQAQADREAADTVINAISAIGEVAYNAESKAKIDAARTAYNALTDAQKALVENYGDLTAAEARYAQLKAAAETQDPPTDPTGPENPSDPDAPAQNGNICKWDNVDHGTSFRGRFVKFFHSILYFFAHLFGLR